MSFFEKLFGSFSDKELKRINPLKDKVLALEPEMAKLTDDELRAKTDEFKQRYQNGETLDQLLPEAFATCREAAWRVLGMRHYRVQIIGGIVAIVFAIFVKQIRKLFPDIVTGTVIFTIGLSLYPTAIRYMAGGSGHPEFGGLKNWFIALLTFAVVLFLNNFTKGVLKLGSLFFGIIVGYVVSLFMGMVDFTNVMNTTSIIAFPQLMHFKIEFAPAACASLAIVYAVNAVQTIGDLTSTTVGGMDRVPTDNELQGGILVQGVASIVGAFFGALPTASYSQNVGIVTMNKVVNRVIFAVSAAVLLIAGLIPGLSAALTTIPQCVIGGATLSVFAQIAMTGVRLFTKDGMTARKTTVVGMSVALGVGITQVSGCLQGPGIPAWINTVFGSSSVVVATIMAIILNLTLPPEE